MPQKIKLEYILSLSIILGGNISLGHAQPTAAAFSADPSAPVATIPVPLPQSANKPVSPRTNSRWQVYDQPLRECLIGNTLIPSNGNDMFAYLFNNSAITEVNMAILGWQHGKCLVRFSEGTQTQYCQFNRDHLKPVLNQILNDTQFNAQNPLATILTRVCQSANPLVR